jgi:hypothetical protein
VAGSTRGVSSVRGRAAGGTGQGRTFGGTLRAVGLEAFAAEHLLAKAKAEKVTDGWLEASELHLRRAVEHLGAARELRSIGVRDVRGWIEALRAKGLTGGTIHHHLASLSNLYRRAQAEEYVPPGYNPVAAMMDKPRASRHEAEFLEVHEAALLLDAARTFRPPPQPHLSYPNLYPLLATMLLTGGRRAAAGGRRCLGSTEMT